MTTEMTTETAKKEKGEKKRQKRLRAEQSALRASKQQKSTKTPAEQAAAKAAKQARKEKYSSKFKRPAGSFDWTCALCGAVNFGSKRREECFCGAKKGAVPVSAKRIEKRKKLLASGKKVNRSGAEKRKAKRAQAANVNGGDVDG